MTEYAHTQIPKPSDEQVFERLNEILFRCVLDDNSVQLYGRRGQAQFGVDLTGCRNADPNAITGVQAKQKGEGKELSEDEVQGEYDKAITFRPKLSEYILVTTAPDSAPLQALALQLSQNIPEGWDAPIRVCVWGWGTMEREISRHQKAREAFDPEYSPHAAKVSRQLSDMNEDITAIKHMVFSDDIGVTKSVVLSQPDTNSGKFSNEIDRYMEMALTQPDMCLNLLTKLEEDFDGTETPYDIYKITASKGLCSHYLGQYGVASELLLSAYHNAPDDPKALRNKVFGLILANRFREAFDFGIEALKSNPNNAGLAGMTIRVMAMLDEDSDPSAVLNEHIENDKEVIHALLIWEIQKGENDEWHERAIAARDAFPDYNPFLQHSANARLEQVIGFNGLLYGHVPSSEEREEVSRATADLTTVWRTYASKEVLITSYGLAIPLNLVTGLRFLNRLSEAQEIMEEALITSPDDVDLKQRAAAVFYECGQYDRAKELLAAVPVTAVNVMAWMNIHMSGDDWSGIVELFENNYDVIPEQDRLSVEAAYRIALIERAPFSERMGMFETILEDYQPDIRGAIVLSQAARANGLDKLGQTYFDIASDLAENGDFSQADRITLAKEAYTRSEYSLSASLLFGQIDMSVDSEEMYILARSISLEKPSRERSLTFFEELPDDIASTDTYQMIQGELYISRRSPERASPYFRRTYSRTPSLQSLNALIRTRIYLNDDAGVRRLLSDERVDKLSGHNNSRIELAQHLRRAGFSERAINLGYEAFCISPESAIVAQGYCGLFLLQDADIEGEWPSGVADGNWVCVIDENGNKFEFLVGEEIARPWGMIRPLADPLLAAAIGKQTGETFEAPSAFGGTGSFTVTETKPRWLQAFHHTTRQFSSRFPGNNSIVSLTVTDEEGGLEPTFRQIRRSSEQADTIADLYLTQGFPMALVSNQDRGGAVGFAQYLVDRNEDIRTCLGTSAEQADAFSLIMDNIGSGAVIDAFTVWRSADIGVLEVLPEIFGEITIPQTEIDTLELIASQFTAAKTERMTLSYFNGQYFRDVRSIEDLHATGNMLTERLKRIKTLFKVENRVLPNKLPELAEAILRFPNGQAIAPIIYAGEEKFFISDDKQIRDLGAQLVQTKGAWLQVILQVGLAENYLTAEEYLDAIVKLSSFRHTHLWVSVDLLLQAFDSDELPLIKYSALCEYIGGQRADIASHVKVVARTISIIRQRHGLTLKTQNAANILFKATVSKATSGTHTSWVAALIVALDRSDLHLLEKWCTGHFIDYQRALDLVREISPYHARRLGL